ncbi:T6SS amidase immunity protein Tai4 family protein [Pedobacter sp. UYP1]|uniref:T6SS amidase immunity protein Tai4 family protein n=1 Tax=Pedobacter sp. UYP1 TaxID=1756396 RepID=UPI003391B336
MGKRLIIIVSIGVMINIIGGCEAPKVPKNADKQKTDSLRNEKRGWVKDYALCECISLVGKNDTTFKNDISPGIYIDISSYGHGQKNIYKDIDSLARKVYSEITPSQIADYGGRKAYTASCIDFYHSKSLDSLVRTYDDEINTTVEELK